jgi:hypothetical protein
MSVADWYFHKADQCGRMAEAATQPDRRATYLHEQKLWLEIAASVVSDDDKRFRANRLKRPT